MRLAITGAIKDTIINLQDVAVFGLRFLEEHYPDRLKERYGLQEILRISPLFSTRSVKNAAV